jgi:hypothetical protein
MREVSFVYAALQIEEFTRRLSAGHPQNRVANYQVQGYVPLGSVALVWAVLDRFPPAKSGIARTLNELIEIANAHGIDRFAEQHKLDEFGKFVHRTHRLISHMKRQDGLYSLCVWENNLQYLCDAPPAIAREGVTHEELNAILNGIGESFISSYGQGGYIRNYIRRREAKRKLSTPKLNSSEPVFVEFLYSPENTWFVPRKRWVWRRHRVVKKTAKTVFIEEEPYQGASYLKSGWQAFIVYTIMIDRAALEANQQFHHRSRRKIFYEKCAAPELKVIHFIDFRDVDDDPFFDQYDDDVIEIPLNGIQWATDALGISNWPVPIEEIKKAFNLISIKQHPDKGGDAAAWKLAKRARDFLIDILRQE